MVGRNLRGATILGAMKLRIDELATRAGTTSRNVRAYQARGLLPAPRLEGRTGYYGTEHLQRLELIDELQTRGFSLAGIREVVDILARGGDFAHLVGIRNLVTAPFSDESPVRYELADLLERFPEAGDDPGLIERAVELGLIELDDGTVVAPSPMLLDAGAELARAGVPLAATLELVAAIRTDIADIAQRFIGLALDHVLRPATEDPDADIGEAIDSLQRLRPIAIEVVRPFLAQALQSAIEDGVNDLGGELDRAAARDPRAS